MTINFRIPQLYLGTWSTVSLLVLPLLLATGCSSDDAQPMDREKRPQQVMIEPVSWQQRDTVIEAVGTSRALQTTMLYPEASDQVTAVLFAAGDHVKQGQPLVQLDNRDELLAVKLAAVHVTDAERLYQRYVNSKGAGAVTESTLDAAASDLEQARIRLQRAQVALDDHVIVAPFAGVMGLTEIDRGARVTPSTPIATIDDRASLLVTFAVPELFHGQLEEGQGVSLSTWSANGPRYQGVIRAIGSQINMQTRMFTVRAAVDNSDDQLRPGMSFKVRLNLSDGRYPAVPEIALQWGGDGAFVWTVADGKAKRVSASVVQRVEGKVLVDAELEDGAIVVTKGTHRVREGQDIQVVNPEVAP